MKHYLLAALAALLFTACDSGKFRVEGQITAAADSLLYLENLSLDGPVVVDSVKLTADGHFQLAAKAADAPEFYRLRIARQFISLAADSAETIRVRADYPTMAAQYDIEGSDDCLKIRELARMQQQLQAQISAIAAAPALSVRAVEDSVQRVMADYKHNVAANYIYREPSRAYAYYALFQTVSLGGAEIYIFSPRQSADDVKCFAAVATGWDVFYPNAARGKNLHAIAIEGMKNQRIIRSQQQQVVPASKVNATGCIEIALNDNRGALRRLSALKGSVVMLDFHAFATQGSAARIMQLRALYDKYHAQGFTIYQVSVDDNQHFWKTQTAALPWTCVNAADNAAPLTAYNVQGVPTFFLIDRQGQVQKRDVQIKDLDAEIQAMLN